MTHQELIAALEKATGPDRELDAQIFWLVDRATALRAYNNGKTGLPLKFADAPEQLPSGGGLGPFAVQSSARRYTESIDAAMTLRLDGWFVLAIYEQPNGWTVKLASRTDDRAHVESDADTLPNATAAAALRSRSKTEGE